VGCAVQITVADISKTNTNKSELIPLAILFPPIAFFNQRSSFNMK
jgi:hypothetical protein